MLHLHHLPLHVRGSLHHLHSSSMSHTEPPLSMHAEPFLFRVAFLAPRLPANMYGQAALSFLPRSISVSSTHPVHVVRRRTHRPFLLVMSSLACSIPYALLLYWTGSIVSTVIYHHPNTFFYGKGQLRPLY
jgi:hypothetical protein